MTEIKSIQSNSKHEKKREPKVPKRISETYLHNSGLYYLERYSAGSAHFKTVMLRKVKRSCHHHTDQDYDQCVLMVEALVEKFISSGLLNDDLYIQGMVSSYRRKGLSTRMISQKLSLKGIKAEKTLEALREFDENHNEDIEIAEKKSAAIFCRRKKLGPFRTKELNDGGEQKEISKLARAGFGFGVIKTVLEMSRSEIEEIIYL